ncbi:MAG: hypothetical protein KME30_23345 [Iphinoe sp. HA4291-MV1]|jgi:hypothetical protein|nr:hypothetical protein [Iphinoe sp. HA4291-MV1]
MRFSQISVILGGTIAAFVSIAPIRAETATYQVQSGVTSVYHDLSYLSSVGLNLTGTDNTVEPINSNFLVGFNITPATNFTFSDVGGLTPLSGTIEHTGTVTFNNQVTVGNFSVGLDPTRATNNASGLFLKDTVSLNTILFDLSTPGTVAFDGKDLTLADVKLLFSPEFAGVLGNSSLAGMLAGIARIDAKVVRVAAVPEGASVLAILSVSAVVLATKRSKLLSKNISDCSRASL